LPQSRAVGGATTVRSRRRPLRICLVYDCLYPCTVGGAERWYRNLALRLAAAGHQVTYLTMRQWDADRPPVLPGVRVVAVAPSMPLYARGRRRILPPLVFGLGVFRHLAGRASNYDVVHTASFPYFSLLAAGLLRRRKRYRLVVDWHEVWTASYWRQYLGPFGPLGYAIQLLCMRFPQEAFTFSRVHERRLHAAAVCGSVTVLRGQYEESADPVHASHREPLVVFAGRHIPEKGVTSVVPAFEVARRRVPDLRCVVYGDGPEYATVLSQIEVSGASSAVEAPGFVDQAIVESALARALCLVLPSRREGYGLVVVEAFARGTPAVVVGNPDNAAVELVESGVNGFVVPSDSAEALAEAIVSVYTAGATIRDSTSTWFARHRDELALSRSLDAVAAAYEGR
jgi:glycosyltransferase involved in cell wall biosynthesis